MEWRPLKEIEANVQMQNPNDEAMFDEATMVDDDEVMGKSKATLQPKPSWFDDDDDCIGQNRNSMLLIFVLVLNPHFLPNEYEYECIYE
ncbi:hypothetical protein TB2_043391 [Malus domestica]